MKINNTASDPTTPYAVLIGEMESPGRGIEAMERRGQVELLNSQQLPTDARGADEALRALGFTLGEPTPGDSLFRPATLPPGWSRVGSDHSMWSYLHDELGRRRVAIFYKAAHYDRRADMALVAPAGYLDRAVYDGVPPILDETWLTADVARAELTKLRDQFQAANHPDDDARAARAQAYLAALPESTAPAIVPVE